MTVNYKKCIETFTSMMQSNLIHKNTSTQWKKQTQQPGRIQLYAFSLKLYQQTNFINAFTGLLIPWETNCCLFRSNHRLCSIWKSVLKKFSKFTGNTCARVSLFKQGSRLRPATLLKKETLAQVFSCEFREIFQNNLFTKPLRRLFLPFNTSIFSN